MKYKITDLDNQQIARYSYDPDAQAQRVVIAGDFGIGEAIKEQLKDIKIEVQAGASEPQIIKVPEIKEIEVPVIVREVEYREIDKPVIVEKVVYREVEKPIIVQETRIERVEVPVIQEQKQVVEVKNQDSKFLKLIFIIQTLTLIAMVAMNFVRK